MSTVRPALDTLRELDEGQFLDKLAVAIHDATAAVTAHGKPGKIHITLKVAPLSKQTLVEPVITVRAKIESDLPEPEENAALFYVDGEGNPTTQQQRQRDLGLQVAPRSDAKEGTHNQ